MQTNPESAAVEAVAFLQRETLNSASPEDYAHCKRQYPGEYEDWFPVYPQSALDALRGEVARLRADARRYRYLRDNAHPDSDEGLAVKRECMSDWGKWYSLHVSGASLDEEIDALTKVTP